MIAALLTENHPLERRVAMIPADMPRLQKLGIELRVERGAGLSAGFPDALYEERGAKIAAERAALLGEADIVLRVRAAGADEEHAEADAGLYRAGSLVIAQCDPLGSPEGVRAFAERKVDLVSLELMPRITRAQSMDVLSSQASIAGYKAVLIAANSLPRMFPMLNTAAGTIKPAKVLVIGAGVAGLQAIATARRLGAVVSAYDVRPAVREQVESLGAKFIEMDLDTSAAETEGGYAKELGESFYEKQRAFMKDIVAAADVVITTAAIPGKKAPVLVTAPMVEAMAPGSLLVDLAAERGGNCELTEAGRDVDHGGVLVMGPVNVPGSVPYHASQMYARNVSSYLGNLVKEGKAELDEGDEIVRETLVARRGEVVHPRVRELLGLGAAEDSASGEGGA